MSGPEDPRSIRFNRRQLIATGAAGLSGFTPAWALAQDAARAVDPAQVFDVIVVGAGTAGMPLAFTAAERGAKVLVVDRGAVVGGTLFLSGGMMTAAGTHLQQRRGIVDTPQAVYDDTMRQGHHKADPEILRLYVDNAADTINWLEDIGLQYLPNQPTLGVHAEFKVRRYQGGAEGGRSILKVFQPHYDKAQAAGRIQTLVNSKVAELTQSRDGAVTGVIVEDAHGRRTQYRGRNVVLTAGGTIRNPVLFKKYQGRLLTAVAGNAYSLGEGLVLGENAGGHISGGQDFVGHRGGILEDRSFPSPIVARASMDSRRRKPWEIEVNAQGQRYVAEDTDIDSLERAATNQHNMCSYVVFDQKIFDQAPPLVNRPRPEQIKWFDGGHTMFARGATLAEAANKLGLPAGKVAETVEAYNKGQASGADAFGRKYMPLPISQGPFYIVETYTSGVFTFAGLDVNNRLQVVTKERKPIPNLYAAGENIGGWHCAGDQVVNGCMVTPSITFGRLLGQRMLAL